MSRRIWRVEPTGEDINLVLERYRRNLRDIGLRESTIKGYTSYLGRFLLWAGEHSPPVTKATEYREYLLDRNMSPRTVNNSCIALRNFYKFAGEDFNYKYLSNDKTLPFFFDQDDILKIFSAASCNIKHLSMLKVLFYGGLRASEICKLLDQDLDIKGKTLMIRQGKGGKDNMVYLTDDSLSTLKRYMSIRPPLEINGQQFLFYTDYNRQWGRSDVYRMFIHYKTMAGITKPGGVHCFSRHSLASILTMNGCDIRVIKEILRHNSVQTTMKYSHLSDATKRAMYDRYIVL
jgi:site-specific recombinase XerD